jgi:hypothetical protein
MAAGIGQFRNSKYLLGHLKLTVGTIKCSLDSALPTNPNTLFEVMPCVITNIGLQYASPGVLDRLFSGIYEQDQTAPLEATSRRLSNPASL